MAKHRYRRCNQRPEARNGFILESYGCYWRGRDNAILRTYGCNRQTKDCNP